ncbi:MAG: hypothetical protein ACREND_02825 [Gemmatimonadaceae bacterium]
MAYFAQLLQRSGVVTGDRAIGARADPAARHVPPSHGAAPGGIADGAEPALRELHEERVVPHDAASDTLGDAGRAEASAPGGARERGNPDAQLHHARRLTRALPPSELPLSHREPVAEDDGRSNQRAGDAGLGRRASNGAPTLPHDISITEIAADPPTAPSVQRTTPTPPESRSHAIADALAQARAWTSLTPLPNEPRSPDGTAPTTRAERGPAADVPARPAPRAEANLSELHVHIGTIEVVVEQPPAVPGPTRAPSSEPVAGTAPASRRLARHHLRG